MKTAMAMTSLITNQIGPGSPGAAPAAEEQRDPESGQRQHVRVLGELEEAPAHAAVLGVVAGHELGLGLGQVERRAVRLRDARDEEHEESDELRPGEPDRLLLLPAIVDERQRAGHQDDAEHRKRERDLVGDELRAGSHRAEQRVLRVARPAADDEAVDADRAEREHEHERDRDVRHPAGHVVVRRSPSRSPRDDANVVERGEHGHDRRQATNRHVDRRGSGRSSPCGSS